MNATSVREIQQAISEAKRRTHRAPEIPCKDLLLQDLRRWMKAVQEARDEASTELEQARLRALERTAAQMLMLARLLEKLSEESSGLDAKLQRMVQNWNRSIR